MYAPGGGILEYCDIMLVQAIKRQSIHKPTIAPAGTGAVLDKAARPVNLSRSGYGVLGIVARRLESTSTNWYYCGEDSSVVEARVILCNCEVQ